MYVVAAFKDLSSTIRDKKKKTSVYHSYKHTYTVFVKQCECDFWEILFAFVSFSFIQKDKVN